MSRSPYIRRLGAFVIWLLVLAAIPMLFGNYEIRIAISIAMFSALALSWNFIGASPAIRRSPPPRSSALAAMLEPWPSGMGCPGLAWALASALVTLFAALLGAIVLRLKGHYFAIGSIAIVEVVRLVVSSWSSLTGGGDGLNVPLLSGPPDVVSATVLYVMLAIMTAAFATTIFVDRSRLGFGLRCIQQNEEAADMVGVDTTRYKIAAFGLSALFCGLVGAVYASWVGYIDPTDSFSILMTVKVPVMVLLGGAGTLLGPVVGAGAFILLEEVFWANFLQWNRAILGVIIVFLIFFLPGGLLKLDYRRWLSRRGDSGSENQAAKEGAP